ncbi:D-amino acid aminotransferase [Eggerthellaceae bacterium zg-1084]|uniref:aminotransferase class IV n=1 Tax=Berryella wangjianweii TaxID=2734634 RepID=UPI001556E620|nr:aminotransferase class IV [Berryella wangjianweii]NPD31027.1 D-amino acid aminotransferase [Berryella wangjianweii]NPD31889.1 D-amino acid aminotransferase [Eggerthellaceae bacterium zg-997]
MENLAYYDGRIGTVDEVQVPFNDRSHFFGDGVYEATMGANGVPFLVDEHLDRFYSSARALDIRIPLEKPQLKELLIELLAKVDGDTHFVYWQVTRGAAMRDHVYGDDMDGKLWVLIRPQALGSFRKPVSLVVAEDKRFEYGNIKTLNLLPAVIYSQLAHRAGAAECVLHRDGVVTECAHSNISILRDGVLYSHPNDEHILRGIAKTHLIQACYRLGISVIERAFTLDDLYDADEVIVTSSSKFCLPVGQIEGVAVGGRAPELLSDLQDEVIAEFRAHTGSTVLD